jgi:hypothetical protein
MSSRSTLGFASTPTDSVPAQTGDDVTAPAVGVDLGVKRLLVAAPATDEPDVPNALVVEGGVERELYDSLGDTLTRFDQLAETTEAEAQAVQACRSMLHQRFDLGAERLLEYLNRVDADLVALEDTTYDCRSLAECARGRTKVGSWLLPTFRDYLENRLAAGGYQVERVDAAYTTQRCHVCGELTDVGNATISCETGSCPVDAVCRDRSAAATIAQRGVNQL